VVRARSAVCSSWTLAKAVDFTILAGAQILNLSLAGPRMPCWRGSSAKRWILHPVVAAALEEAAGAGLSGRTGDGDRRAGQ
jgi:hypothetical protein